MIEHYDNENGAMILLKDFCCLFSKCELDHTQNFSCGISKIKDHFNVTGSSVTNNFI